MISTKTVLSLIASACIATTVSAMEFQVLGARAASMGGAGIATSPSSLAAYNNPALLANNPDKFSLHIGGGVGIKDTGAGKAVGDLSDTGYNTQYIGGGANLDLSFLELNVGLMQNMVANDTAGLIYTAGIATDPKWLHFELAAQMASKKGEIDGTAYPMQAMVNFALSSVW